VQHEGDLDEAEDERDEDQADQDEVDDRGSALSP